MMVIFGRPDIGTSLASYLGLLLVAMFLAVGLFTSSLTKKNQIVA